MRLTCSQDNLSRGLGIVSRSVSTRTLLPVLNNILLETDAGRLKLSATNLDIAITSWIGAMIEEEGAITVPARLFQDFVNSLPSEKPVELSVDPEHASVHAKCGTFEANIKGIASGEFPPAIRPPEEPTLRVESKKFHEAIGQVAFASATDETRPTLTGVLVKIQGDMLTMAAADGFRLAERRLNIMEPVDDEVTVIVPARSLLELARISDGTDDPIDISIGGDDQRVIFQVDEVELVSRLIEGSFPNYEQVIPKSHGTRVIVSREEFQQATRIASLFARDSANILKLQIQQDGEEGQIVVTAAAAERGDTTGGIGAVVEGENAQIAFNAKYLADVLAVLDDNQVSLEFAGPASPGVIKPVGSDAYIHVIMPMHLARN